MAANKSKSKKSSITKKNTPPPYRHQEWPFSGLPPTNGPGHPRAFSRWFQVIKRISAPFITKSWLPPPPTTRCDAHHNQPPQLRHVAAAAPTQNSSYPSPPQPRYRYLLDSASILKAAAIIPDTSHWCVLRHAPTARSTYPAPEPHTDLLGPKLRLWFVDPPNCPRSGLMVRYKASSTTYRDFVLWNKTAEVWHECVTPDPFDPKKNPMEFTSMVRFQGNYYVMSLQGALAVMRVVDTRLMITAVAVGRGVPRSKCRYFKEYLCEMNGEILLVFLIHRESLAVVDHVEVWRLDFFRMDWVKVERLPGKTMFLKEECIGVDSEEFGCRDDRVYFTEGSEKRWKVFNMKTCSVSLVLAEWSWNPLVGP
ncbi:uncharacterized protein LOC121762178 [Salvia splendens]|uniref:uncharacterized protein LOC121762178 n=1 Tax=Salvia splendens TaxID=180675 RepID=UPI001C27A9E6|nr:uncharacterized protein LOC121762178 [Salvia splendens]